MSEAAEQDGGRVRRAVTAALHAGGKLQDMGET